MDAFLKGGSRPAQVSAEDNVAKKRKVAARLPWVEKYRPRTVDELAYQDEVVAVLKSILDGGDLPNLLFYGPPGTGKTSAILAAARQLFGNEGFKTRVLELNASDERGIQIVRDKVKNFAQLSAHGTRPDGKPCPPLKIVILDEADSMTGAAQSALRRTMERESKTTRFCLICNYISRIIQPLTSRCAKFRFKPLSADIEKERLELICSKESIRLSPGALDSLISICEGDLRKSITYLQSAASFRTEPDMEVTEEHIAQMAGVVPDDAVNDVIKACKTGSYEQVLNGVQSLQREGYAAYQFMTQLHDLVVFDTNLKDMNKAHICDKLAMCEKRLLDGGDEFLQLMDLCCTLMTQYRDCQLD